jgi:hypothetical protein
MGVLSSTSWFFFVVVSAAGLSRIGRKSTTKCILFAVCKDSVRSGLCPFRCVETKRETIWTAYEMLLYANFLKVTSFISKVVQKTRTIRVLWQLFWWFFFLRLLIGLLFLLIFRTKCSHYTHQIGVWILCISNLYKVFPSCAFTDDSLFSYFCSTDIEYELHN